ncbi:TPA: hypothetical protein NH725_004728 [Pseudomonas aeruginosa]|uniref:Phage protein n=3 Tax=Pbunavirus TaxID=1198980 RepID=A0A455XIT5_9CAUD|nr:phage protein [Pseudomonas phage R26]AKF13698.1 hypothetical protein [Pseudomonas phage DL52]QIQ65532.1 hypothetical protein 25_00047 [Pseudomonas phage Epa25]QIQ66945.1 hypothetical protein misfit_75 [Pseudomonas phage misfit]UQS93407.1 hypothetical protein Mat_gp094 [Pseudomonas phage vB_Pae_Mat]WNH28323.1 small terminase subunit [Pseudomonas phage phiDCL-PA6]WPF70554.1 hypothetical protein [Pseudomonas phage BL1]HCF0934232.1 hypothetical protein [Pseudomonas aeruginosa]
MTAKSYRPDDLVTPQEFADPQFAAINQKRFDLYIDLRVQGYSSWRVFRAIWGEEHMDGPAQARIFAMESNPYYRKQFKAKLNATRTSDLWNPKTALHELLQMVRDPTVKDSSRLSAIKELNVLAEITFVDESGKTRVGRGLADFYASEAEAQTATVAAAAEANGYVQNGEEGDFPSPTPEPTEEDRANPI